MAPRSKKSADEEESPAVEETFAAESSEEESSEIFDESPAEEPEAAPLLAEAEAPVEEPPPAVVGPAGVVPGRLLKVGRVTYRVLSIVGPNTVRAAIPNTGKIVTLDL